MNLVAALLVVALAPAPTPVAPDYVALGDSYAAGVGADRDKCGRSSSAYPELVARARGWALDFAACAGATSGDVGEQARRISAGTALVTVTVGGNDVAFADVMKACVLGGERACERRVAVAEEFIRAELPGRVDAVFGAVRERTSAPVVVLGYPRLFEVAGSCLLGVGKRVALNRAADLLDEVVRGRAEVAGFRFGDVREAFAGHGACGGDPWVNDLSVPVGDSYHPNGAGHRFGYLPVLERLVGVRGHQAGAA